MKKLLLALVFVFYYVSFAYGVASDDVYVRKDVFEVHLQAINSNMEKILLKLETLDKSMNELTQNVAVMSERIDRNFETLSGRIDGLDARVSDLRNDIYLWLMILGIVVALPSVQKFLQWRDERQAARKSSITLEQVEELINAKFREKLPQ